MFKIILCLLVFVSTTSAMAVDLVTPIQDPLTATITSFNEVGGVLYGYDSSKKVRLSTYNGGLIYHLYASSGLDLGKSFFSENTTDVGKFDAMIRSTNISGCQVQIGYSRDGEIVSAKGNCDPLAAIDSNNNAG
jgi:opacity protein-like surface antigen